MAVLVEFTTEPILAVTASGKLCPTVISEIKRLSRKLGMAKNSRNQAVEIEKSGDGTFFAPSSSGLLEPLVIFVDGIDPVWPTVSILFHGRFRFDQAFKI
jgi:hypothetical protein